METEASDGNRVGTIRWGAVLASFLLTPVAGYIAIGRWRRAAVLVVAEIIYLAICGVAVLAVIPALMYAALFLATAHGLGAIVDIGRLSRTTGYKGSVGWILAGGVAALIFWQLFAKAFRANVVEAFQTPGGSMIPALEVGDHFFVGKPFRTVRRGDVIVFRFPLDPSVDYVKRAVALAGDSVEIVQGQLVVNGQPVPSKPLGPETKSIPGLGPFELERWRETLDGRSYDTYRNVGSSSNWSGMKVPAGHAFVMGDNRDNSNDSRVWGTLPLHLVKGRALFIWWSTAPEGVRWNRINKRIE